MMSKCPTCGDSNRPASVYCRSCGGRLLNPELISKEEEKRLKITQNRLQKKTKNQFTGKLSFIIPLFILCLTVYLISRPISLPRELNISWRYSTKCQAKLLELKDSFNNSKKHRVGITEDELNSYIKDNLPIAQQQSMDIFLDDGLVIYITHKILNRNITLKIYSGLLVEDKHFKPDILQVRLGKLPIPSFIINFIINKFLHDKISQDIICPDFITGFEFSENIMYVKYDPEHAGGSTYADEDKETVDQLLTKGNNLFEKKKYQEALSIYDKIIKYYPDDSRVKDLKNWRDEITEKYLKEQ